ncbi:MAG: hypothetical protein Q8O40_11525 [Chloroflexota bacterium]|nr:hypothetical protein [Chloroflexota bacterium]
MKKRGIDNVPEFQSLEEERQYWEARGPVAEGRRGRLNKPQASQRRSSFLAVRLTGEELTRLRDTAAKRGLGPSTFARGILLSAIEGHSEPSSRTAGEFAGILEARLTKVQEERVETLFNKVVIGDPKNPVLLVFAGEKQTWQELASVLFSTFLAMPGARVFTPEDETYKKLRDMVSAEA